MHNIIINADDFGKSKEITFAILSAMDLNLCLDTTLLVNFEDSYHAASLAIDTNKKDNIGIHLNLTEGNPLTDNIKKERRFCNEEGLFHYSKNERIICLSTSEKRAVYEELTSQIHLCRSFGIPISHADSHNHIHEEPGLLFIFIHTMKKEKIPFLRITKNIGTTSFINKVYRESYNSILSLSHLAGSDHFGNTSDFVIFPPHPKKNSITELMIHPGFIKNDQIIDIYAKENLSIKLPEIINGNNLISFNHIKR